MVKTGGDRTIGYEVMGGGGSGRGRREGRRRDGVVGYDGFGTEDRGYNVAYQKNYRDRV